MIFTSEAEFENALIKELTKKRVGRQYIKKTI